MLFVFATAMLPNGCMEHESLEGRLAECERHLGVAAEMGLALLSRNEMMEGETARLSENLSEAESRIAQLHDLAVKDSLLDQYTNISQLLLCSKGGTATAQEHIILAVSPSTLLDSHSQTRDFSPIPTEGS